MTVRVFGNGRVLRTGRVLALTVILAGGLPPELAAKPSGRALSLRVLIVRLRESSRYKNISDQVAYLGGMSRLEGFMIDEVNSDVVLVGRSATGGPALWLEDFIVALRSAGAAAGTHHPTGTFRFAPLCSLDPAPATVEELTHIAAKITSRSSDRELPDLVDKWEQTCRSPQVMHFEGVTRDSRFARIMLQADYLLKTLVDGPGPLPLQGLQTHLELVLSGVRHDYQNGRRPHGTSLINRFWFSGGETVFARREKMVICKKAPVVLLTEAQHISQNGRRQPVDRNDSLARQFASEITHNFAALCRVVPEYAELRNLFRFMAVARALVFEDVFARAGCDAGYLLKEWPLPERPPLEKLPGRARLVADTCFRDTPQGRARAIFRIPCCGGVSMRGQVTANNFVDGGKEVTRVAREVGESRPSRDSLTWEFDFEWIADNGAE